MNMEELIEKNELELTDIYKEIDKICRYNSKKVLEAFHKNQVSESHFNSTTGYGYNDEGRDTIEKVFADVFKCEDALVRGQFISGTHALAITLSALLRPNDTMISITGAPYDTLQTVIGCGAEASQSSLKAYGIKYEQIELIDNEEYMSPSNYLFARNYTIIMSNLYYIEKELNKWYKLVKDKTKERVCVVHNNLKKDNFFRGKKNILTGWDNYLVDTPVLDIYKLYRSEYNNVDMEYLLKVYNENNKLNEEEIILFNILISMPLNTNEELNEYDKVKEIKSCLFYTYKTSNFIKSNVFN